MMFAATEITPRAPSAMAGGTWSSLPQYTATPSPQVRARSVIWRRLPEASFTAQRFGCFASSATVSASRFTPVRPGTLYMMIGMSTASATAL